MKNKIAAIGVFVYGFAACAVTAALTMIVITVVDIVKSLL